MADYRPVDLVAGEQVAFTLNGDAVTAPAGTMIVDAANAHGVEVPIFCYEPRLGDPLGACRMCLVKVEGMRGFQTACSTPVAPDMIVDTVSHEVADAQNGILELILANHPLDCPVCDKGGECPLQDRTFAFGPGRSRFTEMKRHFPKPLELSPRIALDRERCISCFRCVRFSQEVAEDGALIFQERGAQSQIATFTGDSYEGRFTGNVIDLCPVGALTSIPYRFVARPWDIANAPSVCTACPVGCNTELTAREEKIQRVTGRPDPNWEVEEGWICDKGRWSFPLADAPERLVTARGRDSDAVRDLSLDNAVTAAAALLGRPGAVGIVIGEEATVEEAQACLDLAEGALGGATVARLGIPGDALVPLRRLPGAQLGDLDRADLIAVVGGDPANQQPVVELRVRKAARRGARVLTVGARRHALETVADARRAEPAALMAALSHVAEAVAGATTPVVLWDEADLAGEADAPEALARLIAANPAARQLELGHSVNGAGLRALGVPATGVLERIESGELRSLLTVHAEPATAPAGPRWQSALARVESHIAIATHGGPSLRGSDVIIPALTAFEQDGVVVSMNGRAQRTRPGARGPEGAAPAWEILVAIAARLGAPPPYRSAREAFDAAASRHSALAGLSYTTLGALGAPIRSEGPVGHDPVIATEEGEGLPLVITRPIYGDRVSELSDALRSVRSRPGLTLSPSTASRHDLRDGGLVRLASPHGSAELRLRIDPEAAADVAFVMAGVPSAAVDALLPEGGVGPVRVEIGTARA